jgi:pyruvate formate lyase activating enzyme
MIFNIQRFSIHDGSGVRTIIFYKGCPLQCEWCSNPESQSFTASLMYDNRNCKNFEDCLNIENNAIYASSQGVEINRKKIVNIEKYRNVCASKALTVSGVDKSVAELLYEIEKDAPFYQNEGGITLSGGEPLSQGNDLVQLLKELKRKQINVAIETSLYVKWEKVESCLDLVDTFLVDLKHTDKHKFEAQTKGNLDLVMSNLINLTKIKNNVIIRVPVIPGFNHTFDEMKQIIELVVSLHVKEIHFLPYHILGIEKYKMLSMDYIFGNKPSVKDSELTEYINYARSKGLITKIGG